MPMQSLGQPWYAWISWRQLVTACCRALSACGVQSTLSLPPCVAGTLSIPSLPLSSASRRAPRC